MLHDLSFSDSFHARVSSQTQLISHMVSEEAILQISYGLKQLSRISFAAIFDSLLFDCAIQLSFGALSNEIQGFVLVDRSYDLSMYDRLNNWLDRLNNWLDWY